MWPRYQLDQTYQWNYQHAPREPDWPVVPIPPMPQPTDLGFPNRQRWTFCGRPVGSPLGIAAGPLLNGHWVLYYSQLGFEVLTYKTVRSQARACYPLPNLVPVDSTPLTRPCLDADDALTAIDGPSIQSWAVSFGMPSATPDAWRADVLWTRRRLDPAQLLCVSVVGTTQPGWSLQELASDYALCAQWAVQSGADVIEANLSCPNVSTCDGQLFQQPSAAATVAERVREAIGATPLVLKIGFLQEPRLAEALLQEVARYADAVNTTNSIAARVRGQDGQPLFENQPRGICGAASRLGAIGQVALCREIIHQRRLSLDVIGVGGVSSAGDVQALLDAGAESVQIATAAMLDPTVSLAIRQELTNPPRPTPDGLMEPTDIGRPR